MRKCDCGRSVAPQTEGAPRSPAQEAAKLAEAISKSLACHDRTAIRKVRPILADAVNDYRRRLLTAVQQPRETPEPATPPEHRCGVRGFADSGDQCPGCLASGRVSRRPEPATPPAPSPSDPGADVWDCRLCGFGVSGPAVKWIADNGYHRNALGNDSPNKGTAYCPYCDDETLRSPSPASPKGETDV